MSASLARKIIVAGNAAELQPLIELLRQKGFDARFCSDGAKALEQSLTFCPALMLLDTEIALLGAEKLAQILRTNPRTEGMAFFYLGGEGRDVEGFRRHKDQYVVRPFNCEELLGAILNYARRLERTEQIGHQDQEVEGSLSQISLIDLLQIFGLNRRDGVLSLAHGERRGSISLLGGMAVNAHTGRVEGEKAFFRLLRWQEGQFSFRPGRVDETPRITLTIDHLIMEGLRQNDELEAQKESLLQPDAELELRIPLTHLPPGLRPTTQEVLTLLQHYRRVGDILDHSSRPDFEILQLLKVLLDKGLIEERKLGFYRGMPRTALLTSEEVIATRDDLGEGRSLLEAATAKLLLLFDTGQDIRGFLQALMGIEEFVPEADAPGILEQIGLGDVGRLQVTENFSLRLFCLPATADSAPLWKPFCRRLFGVITLGDSARTVQAEEYFREQADTPVVRVSCERAVEGAFHFPAGDRAALRQLLAGFAERFRSRVVVSDLNGSSQDSTTEETL